MRYRDEFRSRVLATDYVTVYLTLTFEFLLISLSRNCVLLITFFSEVVSDAKLLKRILYFSLHYNRC